MSRIQCLLTICPNHNWIVKYSVLLPIMLVDHPLCSWLLIILNILINNKQASIECERKVNELLSLVTCNNAASPAEVCPDINGGEGIKTFYESHTSLTHSFQTNSKLVLYFYYACMSIKYYYSFSKMMKCSNVFEILCDSFFCWCACVFACWSLVLVFLLFKGCKNCFWIF